MYGRIVPEAALTLAFAALAAHAGELLVDDFSTVAAWSINADGGAPSDFAADPEGGMRVRYRDAVPHWSNLRREVAIPASATAIRIAFRLHEAAPGAALHLWLFEPDGDGWIVQVTDEGKPLGAMAAGRHELTVPLASFRFDDRGAKTRGMAGATKLLLGMNYGDLDVTVERLAFVTREAAEADEPPRTEGLAPTRGPLGALAILRDTFPPSAGASSPEALAAILEPAGWGIAYLTGGDLGAEGVLTRANYDALVLPYGPAYPWQAGGAIQRYLAEGGALVSTGGYALDTPMSWTGPGWEPSAQGSTVEDIDAGHEARGLNTRTGRSGDAMGFDPAQIQLFDPAFLLERVASVVDPADGRTLAELPVTGYSAVSTCGSHSPVFPVVHGRRIPLAGALDRLGRPRGTVGALVHNFAGAYAGSSWVAFGVTSHDLFPGPEAPLASVLASALEQAVHPAYLARLSTELACYRAGEEVVVRGECVSADPGAVVAIEAPGLLAEPLEVALGPAGGDKPGLRAFTVTLPAVGAATPDLVEVRATLHADGRSDSLATAFVTWSESVIARGPQVEMTDAQLRVNGRATVLEGTNETGFVWFSEHEDPLVWDADFRAMADHGVNVCRLLHFSPFSEGGYEGKPSNRPQGLANRPERLARATDALVQLAQKHGVILFLSLHDWMEVGLSDADLAAQCEWDRFWAERYRGVPGIIYDIQNEPSIGEPVVIAELQRLYNELLAARYGDEAGLRAAWSGTDPGGTWGSLPVRKPAGGWADAAATDWERWKLEVFRRWTMANYRAVREADPDALVTVGFLPWNAPADIQTGARGLDFTNFHYYGDLEGLATILPFLDRRWDGMPLSIGEFGAQEAHGARNAGLDGTRPEESIRRFLWTGHHLLARGGSFLANWSWKDFEGSVFPWGIRYLQDPVSKDVLLAYRAQALLFRTIEPVQETPRLFVVLPDSHRFGATSGAMEGTLRNCFRALYHVGEPFGVIGEWELEHLPAGVAALIWPMPWCPSDETFERLASFVEAGGALCTTGDFGFDEHRKPTRGARYARLGLSGPAAHVEPGAVEAALASAEPALARVGQGIVLHHPFPLEERAPERLVGFYRSFLSAAGGEPPTPSDPPVRVVRQSTEGGGHVDMLACAGGQADATATASGFTTVLRPWECALLSLDGEGGLRAFHARELTGPEGRQIARGEVDWIVATLDDQPLDRSRAVLLVPLGAGNSSLALPGVGADATLSLGEFDGCAWRERVRLAPASEDGAFALTIDADEALSPMVLAAPDAYEAAVTRLEGLLRLTR